MHHADIAFFARQMALNAPYRRLTITVITLDPLEPPPPPPVDDGLPDYPDFDLSAYDWED